MTTTLSDDELLDLLDACNKDCKNFTQDFQLVFVELILRINEEYQLNGNIANASPRLAKMLAAYQKLDDWVYSANMIFASITAYIKHAQAGTLPSQEQIAQTLNVPPEELEALLKDANSSTKNQNLITSKQEEKTFGKSPEKDLPKVNCAFTKGTVN